MTTDNSNNGLARRNADNDLAAPQDSRQALQPRSMKEAYELAKAVAGTPFAPNMNAAGAFASIVSGSELGLTAMQSLRAYAVVKGKPTLWADAMVAVVLASGLCESWETIETSAERCEIVTRRKGSKRDQRCVWTRADAERAKLLGSDTWKMYPAQMLRHRCASDLARSVFPDVLLGVYSHEEMRDSAPLRSDPVERFDAPADELPPAIVAQPSALQLPRDNGPGPSGKPLPAAEAPIVEAPPVALPLSDRDHRAMLDELTSATDLAALRAAWKGMADDEKRGTEEQRAALLDAATKRKAVFAEEARLREERKAAADVEPPNDDGPTKPPRGPRKARKDAAPADATGGGAEGADGPVDAPGARSSSGHPMTTRAERLAHLATLPLAETVRLSWRHRAAMPPPHYREDCALRVCALTHGFGVEDALAYLDAAPLRVVAAQPKTRAA